MISKQYWAMMSVVSYAVEIGFEVIQISTASHKIRSVNASIVTSSNTYILTIQIQLNLLFTLYYKPFNKSNVNAEKSKLNLSYTSWWPKSSNKLNQTYSWCDSIMCMVKNATTTRFRKHHLVKKVCIMWTDKKISKLFFFYYLQEYLGIPTPRVRTKVIFILFHTLFSNTSWMLCFKNKINNFSSKL